MVESQYFYTVFHFDRLQKQTEIFDLQLLTHTLFRSWKFSSKRCNNNNNNNNAK